MEIPTNDFVHFVFCVWDSFFNQIRLSITDVQSNNSCAMLSATKLWQFFFLKNFDSSTLFWLVLTYCNVSWSNKHRESSCLWGQGVSFLHRSWRPKDWAGRVDFRGVSSYVFQFVLCDVFYLDEFSGQRFDVVFDVLVLLLPGQRTPEFPRSNFQMTVKKFLWSKNFLWFPSEINFCWMNIPRKGFFFFWKLTV